MEEKKNLNAQEAIDKLKELTDDKVCMFCTHTGSFDIQGRPMSTSKTDKEGHLWFLSDKSAGQNKQIQAHNQVDLFYTNSDNSYCAVKGKAEIHDDREKIDQLWTGMSKAWFPEGKDDPRISVIKVIPSEAFYWDSKSNRFVSFLKIATAAAMGSHAEVGVKGDLNV